ncbi:YmaF family protein [Clostridium sp. CTA-19]
MSSKFYNCRDHCIDYEYDNCPREQTHTHEFLGSTKLAEECDERHNHRFAGVTGQAIRRENSHVHEIEVKTDFFDHFHKICILTGPAIPVGNGKHVHLVTGMTTFVDGHRHDFIFTTLIESPLV